MTRERESRTLGDALEALSRQSVAAMLREMAGSLGKLAGCAYLSPMQERHIGSAARHINAAVGEWIGEVMDAEALRLSSGAEPGGNVAPQCSGCPECPGRAGDHVTTMLGVYDHDFGKRDFTPMQLNFLMIAVHNLVTISKEIMTSVR